VTNTLPTIEVTAVSALNRKNRPTAPESPRDREGPPLVPEKVDDDRDLDGDGRRDYVVETQHLDEHRQGRDLRNESARAGQRKAREARRHRVSST
jgi:hypothetical protein